jgi:hypothetical protein
VEYVVVGILKGYREGEEAIQDLELAGITGGQVQLITDTDDDARTISTPGEKSTDPPKPHHNWLAKLFGNGGALEPVVRADSGSQPGILRHARQARGCDHRRAHARRSPRESRRRNSPRPRRTNSRPKRWPRRHARRQPAQALRATP